MLTKVILREYANKMLKEKVVEMKVFCDKILDSI